MECEVCGKYVANQKWLKNHMKRHHQQDFLKMKKSGKDCGFCLKSISNLAKHVCFLDSGKCALCTFGVHVDKVKSDPTLALKHMRTRHHEDIKVRTLYGF